MMNNQWQNQNYRNQRRGYRRGAFGGMGIVWFIIIIAAISSNSWHWIPLPMLLLPLIFFFAIRSRSSMRNGPINQQPYMQDQPINQQPYNQPYMQEQPPYEQPMPQSETPYQAYSQGYQAQPALSRTYQESEQRPQYEVQQPENQQYEEPLTMYPQE